MSNPAVLAACAARLEAVSGLPTIVWPNDELPAVAPFIIWDDGPQVGRPITIDGEERFEYRPQVSVMVAKGTHSTDTDAHLWAIAQAFKFGTKIGTMGAYCPQTPVPDNGYPDGAFFRRTMTLRIVSHQQI